MVVIKKKEGFEGQKAIVLPHSIIHMLEKNPITAPIHITDIGYYPSAKYHYRERQHGCKQHILIFCVLRAGHEQPRGTQSCRRTENSRILKLPAPIRRKPRYRLRQRRQQCKAVTFRRLRR